MRFVLSYRLAVVEQRSKEEFLQPQTFSFWYVLHVRRNEEEIIPDADSRF